jgi:branched-chain amino acid aminotransferase
VREALDAFRLPATLGFGVVPAPVMYGVDWNEGAWGRGELRPYGPIEIWPGSRALHYAELVFEGMKAYRVGQKHPNLFRPRENWLRLVRSAERLAMPAVPEALFMEGIDAVAGACAAFVPDRSGQALYLRPFLFGTEAGYIVRNSRTFRFMVIANPSEVYQSGSLSVAIERADSRACRGGIGEAKTAGNYAASLRAASEALGRGCSVNLWLDAHEHRYIQELSGMNVFAVIEGELHTPALDGAILPGITRDSLLAIARNGGWNVHERLMPIDELLQQIRAGACTELFASGTAAIVSPIGKLADGDGTQYVPPQVDRAAAVFREALLSIQERRAPDAYGWTRDIPISFIE